MRSRLTLNTFLLLLFFFVFAIVTPLLLHAKTPNASQLVTVPYSEKGFIDDIAKRVKPYAKIYGIRPSIVIGQIVIDSQNGQSILAAKYHNLFSMLAKPGDNYVILESTKPILTNPNNTRLKFSSYPNWEASIADYFACLRQGTIWDKQLYHQLATQEGYKAPAESLGKYIYSYDKNYPTKLIKVIEDKNLTQYD
ncbi:glucosaminidase domain-containing protein [Streptococcus hongkongensis]